MRAACLFLILGLGGCAGSRAPTPEPAKTSATDPKARCCEQCRGAAQRDPTGADISGKTCNSYPADYNGGPGIDDECRAWFAAQSQAMTVGDCSRTP
jgi:hypothetical protein